MATEGGRNYLIPVLVHAIAIAVGAYLGFVVMDKLALDLPDDSVDPGVSASAPKSVAGADPDSLLRAANLAPALAELDDQLAAGDGIVRLHVEPGSLDADTSSADGAFAPGDVPADVPARIGTGIAQERGLTLDAIRYMDLVATAKGPRWYVQLDINRDIGPPPWTYGAPLDGAPLDVGAAPPEPIDG